MAQGKYTENYNFYIPDGSELGLIIKLVLEPNFTIIDQQLNNLDNEKIDVEKIANNLITEEVGYVLGAGQGKILDDKKFDKGNVSEEFDTAEKIEKLLKGNSGITDVIYIQDAGTKTYGKGYIDKETGELYMCIVESTESVDVDENFELATNISNNKRKKNLIRFPDWSKTVRKDDVDSYTAEFDCIVNAMKLITRGEYQTKIDGKEVGRTYLDYNGRVMQDYILKKGQKLTNTVNNWDTIYITPFVEEEV